MKVLGTGNWSPNRSLNSEKWILFTLVISTFARRGMRRAISTRRWWHARAPAANCKMSIASECDKGWIGSRRQYLSVGIQDSRLIRILGSSQSIKREKDRVGERRLLCVLNASVALSISLNHPAKVTPFYVCGHPVVQSRRPLSKSCEVFIVRGRRERKQYQRRRRGVFDPN